MSGVGVILVMLLVFFVIGVLIYIPVRWLVGRNSDTVSNSPKVTPWMLIQMAAAVGTLLVLAWYMEAGNKIASVVWGLIAIGGNIWLYFAVKKNKESDHGRQQ